MNKILEGSGAKRHYSGIYSTFYNSHKWLWDFITFNKSENSLRLFLKENINENTKILDLGCGTGNNLMNIVKLNLNFKNYVGVDISPDMLKIAKNRFLGKKNVNFIEADIRKDLGYLKNFDIVICTWVFSHINKPDDITSNFHKSIKNGGKIYLIFLSKPKWYMGLLFFPLEKMFKTRYAKEEEIKRFGNITRRDSFLANLITTLEIKKV